MQVRTATQGSPATHRTLCPARASRGQPVGATVSPTRRHFAEEAPYLAGDGVPCLMTGGKGFLGSPQLPRPHLPREKEQSGMGGG